MVATRGASQPNTNKLGLFSEMGYTTIGEPYTAPNARPYNESASKGKQMLTTHTKQRTALSDGYFSNQFVRVFEKEAYSDVVKRRRQDRMQSTKKNIVPQPFLPADKTKVASGVGSYYGTFGLNGQLYHKYFSGGTKEKPPHTSPPRNFVCNPSKKGSGYGYVGVTIGEYAKNFSEKIDAAHEIAEQERKESQRRMVGGAFKLNMHPKPLFKENPYKADKSMPTSRTPKDKATRPLPAPFKPTSPSKRMGNCKAGTFSKYPTHPVDGYAVKAKKPVGPKYGVFNPPTIPKSRPTDSLLRRSVNRKLNRQNFTRVQAAF